MKRWMAVWVVTMAVGLAGAAGAESVRVWDNQGTSRMLDVQRQGNQIQVWDFTNGGLTWGQTDSRGGYFMEFGKDRSYWIEGQGLTDREVLDVLILQMNKGR